MISVKIFDTPVKVKLTVLPIILVLWGGLTWFGLSRHPERGFWLSLLIGLAVFTLVRGSPVVRELMAFSAVGHGLLLVMSLFPLPLVDGGTLLSGAW
jgi:hypothetical protein